MTPNLPRRALASILATACAACMISFASDSVAQDPLASITSARSKVRTLSAKFTQQRELGLLATAVTSKGELTLSRPNRLRWELLSPDPIVYWVGPSGLSYQSATSSGSVDRSALGPATAVLDDILVLVGGDLSKLRDHYTITTSTEPEGGMRIVAVPKTTRKKGVKKIDVVVATDLVSPKSITIHESDTDRATIRFESVKLNPPVDEAKLRPPPKR